MLTENEILKLLKLIDDYTDTSDLIDGLITFNIVMKDVQNCAERNRIDYQQAAQVMILKSAMSEDVSVLSIDPRWDRQQVTSIKCKRSGSGNITWLCALVSGKELYIRHGNKYLWINAGYGDIEKMVIGDTWDADITCYTLPGDKGFLDCQQVVEGGSLTNVGEQRRAAAAATAWEWLNRENIYVLDFETTGLSTEAEIVSYCVLDVNGNVLGEGTVQPTISIPLHATVIHGLEDDDVEDSPWIMDATIDGFKLPEFLTRFSDRIVTWNASFDARLFAQSMAAHGIEIEVPEWRCAMKLYSDAYGTWNDKRQSYDSISLVKAAAEEGVTYGPHIVRNDTLAALEVLRALARRSPF